MQVRPEEMLPARRREARADIGFIPVVGRHQRRKQRGQGQDDEDDGADHRARVEEQTLQEARHRRAAGNRGRDGDRGAHAACSIRTRGSMIP